MHEMRTTAIGDHAAWCVCQSVVCLHPAKTAERIDVLFAVETPGDPRNRPTVLGGVPIPVR